eukprot:TRINITY_DN11685_c0_g1_i5.p1 TRINITY_DN11685_c0_g1~~TRINITY_DN11685_c0_g1_i5.p1  ORF type:complete len:368 (-),score=9.49 TRINITY_DN11685_c0_g1_i5:262-1365(-)
MDPLHFPLLTRVDSGRICVAEVDEDTATRTMLHVYRPDWEARFMRENSYLGIDNGKFPKVRLPTVCQEPFCLRRDASNCKKFSLPLLVSFAWWVGCCYLNNLAQVWLENNIAGFYEAGWGYSQPNATAAQMWLKDHMPDKYEARWGNLPPNQTTVDTPIMKQLYRGKPLTLFDITFIATPYKISTIWAKIFAWGSLLVSVIRFVIVPGPLSMRWTFMIRAFLIWGTLWLCRALTIVVTPLPNPEHDCVPNLNFALNLFHQAYDIFFGSETCQDVLFSGHTSLGTLSTLFLWNYRVKTPWVSFLRNEDPRSLCHRFFNVCFISWLIFGWFVIAASHFHYTVDVLIGALLAFMCFSNYHYDSWYADGYF